MLLWFKNMFTCSTTVYPGTGTVWSHPSRFFSHSSTVVKTLSVAAASNLTGRFKYIYIYSIYNINLCIVFDLQCWRAPLWQFKPLAFFGSRGICLSQWDLLTFSVKVSGLRWKISNGSLIGVMKSARQIKFEKLSWSTKWGWTMKAIQAEQVNSMVQNIMIFTKRTDLSSGLPLPACLSLTSVGASSHTLRPLHENGASTCGEIPKQNVNGRPVVQHQLPEHYLQSCEGKGATKNVWTDEHLP